MPEPTPASRFTLRQLPLPAKLVVSTFLLAVGLGYTSAMIQLHMGHSSKDGNPLPTVDDVRAVFAGKVWQTGGEPRPVCRLEEIVSGSPEGKLTKANMTPAFFAEDAADYEELARKDAGKVNAERDGERKAVLAFVNAAPEARKTAYDENRFPLPPALAGQPLTGRYVDEDQPGAVKIQSILRDRCARCHKPGGEKSGIPLHTYDDLNKLMPKTSPVPPGGGWVDSGRQITLGALTQSTHAHLLSFAVLFSLTGFIFACTSYPTIVRVVVGPLVLIAQVADISCWWLARLPESGPYFAMCILGTGAVVGLGLGAHIVLSLFNMYGWKGKAVLTVLFLFAGVSAGLAWSNVIDPYLKGEKAKVLKAKEDKEEADRKAADEKGKNAAAKAENGKGPVEKNGKSDPPLTGPSRLEILFTGSWKTAPWPEDGKIPDGGMVRAFFDKEGDFKAAIRKKDPELPTMTAEREGELAFFLAWIKSAAEVRKKAYDDDKFVSLDLRGKPLTAEFKADDTTLKIRTLIELRCQTCHKADDKIPFTSYDELAKFLRPTATAAIAPAPAKADPVAPKVETIPPATD
jgi:hypothetical protein